MEGHDKSTVQQIIRMMLRPVASLVLNCGMTWKEFADLSKSTFVERATEEFGIRGRPTNVSRVSILTGISRKEVKRQRDLLSGQTPAARGKTTDATRVLSAWHNEKSYTDGQGVPLVLAQSGPVPSFESLCAKYGGDIPATTMLKELLNTGAIERTEDDRLKVILRYFLPAIHDEEILRFAVARICDLTDTVNNNVFPGKDKTPRFGGAADNDHIPASAIPDFKEFVDDRAQAFLEEIDGWLSKNAVDKDTKDSELVRLGVGVFAIEDKNLMENER